MVTATMLLAPGQTADGTPYLFAIDKTTGQAARQDPDGGPEPLRDDDLHAPGQAVHRRAAVERAAGVRAAVAPARFTTLSPTPGLSQTVPRLRPPPSAGARRGRPQFFLTEMPCALF